MVTRATHSYEYNAICDVCRRKFKASELRKRWDNLMVCKDDFEYRHPSDFYRVRNDSHKLPFTRPDVEVETTYTPTVAVTTTGTVVKTGSYILSTLTSKTTFEVRLTPDNPQGTADTTAASGVTCTTPTTTGGTGSFTVMGSRRGLIGTGTIAAGATTITLPNWAATSEVITIKGQYGT